MTTDTKQVIYSMMRVGRIHPPNKQVLRDISLGFYYGAKIGVLGLNGAGKSTLLRIMAGVDKDYVGEIAMSKGYTVGFLEPYGWCVIEHLGFDELAERYESQLAGNSFLHLSSG